MVPLYETLIAHSVFEIDRSLLDSMRAKIDDELKKLDEKSVSFSLPFPQLCSHLFSMILYFRGLCCNNVCDSKLLDYFTSICQNVISLCLLIIWLSNFPMERGEGDS